MKILWLLVLGIPLVVMVGLIIIANRIPSFNERRKGESVQAISIPRIRFNPKWIIILLVLVCAGFLITKIHFSKSIIYPIAANAQDVWVHIGETVKVKIIPDSWSGWINLPPGIKFLVDVPGEVECLFWSGERISIKDKNTQWLGEVPNCSFRMRGAKGEATITVQ